MSIPHFKGQSKKDCNPAPAFQSETLRSWTHAHAHVPLHHASCQHIYHPARTTGKTQAKSKENPSQSDTVWVSQSTGCNFVHICTHFMCNMKWKNHVYLTCLTALTGCWQHDTTTCKALTPALDELLCYLKSEARQLSKVVPKHDTKLVSTISKYMGRNR